MKTERPFASLTVVQVNLQTAHLTLVLRCQKNTNKRTEKMSLIALIKMTMDWQNPHICTALGKILPKHKDPESPCHQPTSICHGDINQQQSFHLFATSQQAFPNTTSQQQSEQHFKKPATQTSAYCRDESQKFAKKSVSSAAQVHLLSPVHLCATVQQPFQVNLFSIQLQISCV